MKQREVQQYDMTEIRSTVREEVFARELFWLERLRGESDLPAVKRLYSHGWLQPQDLQYVLVVELPEASLFKLLETGALELRLPGSTKLLAARCLYSYFETAEALHARYSLISPSICPQGLFVRSDW